MHPIEIRLTNYDDINYVEMHNCQNKNLHNFRKRGQRSIVGRSIYVLAC